MVTKEDFSGHECVILLCTRYVNFNLLWIAVKIFVQVIKYQELLNFCFVKITC